MKRPATRCHWRGPAKPQADDYKFAKAVETLRNMGVITDEWICGELGEDWEDIYEQRQREKQKRTALDLPDSAAPAGKFAPDPSKPQREDEDETAPAQE